jgi:hypothetical protein
VHDLLFLSLLGRVLIVKPMLQLQIFKNWPDLLTTRNLIVILFSIFQLGPNYDYEFVTFK